MEYTYNDIHIGDTVITKDKVKGVIHKIESLPYANYKRTLEELPPITRHGFKFSNMQVIKKYLFPITIYIAETDELHAICLDDIESVDVLKYDENQITEKDISASIVDTIKGWFK